MKVIEEVERIKAHAEEEIKKRRNIEQLLSKVEEDNRLLQQQLRGRTAATQNTQQQHVLEPPIVQQTSNTDSGSSRPRSFNTRATASSDVASQLLQVLREATSVPGQGGEGFGRTAILTEEYPDFHSMRTFYKSLKPPWDIVPPEQGQVKEYYKVKDANKDKFGGDRLNYLVFRR
jgi:hypothetical protein